MIPLFDSNRRNVVAPVTMTVIVANMILFAFQLLLAQQGRLEEFFHEFGFIPASVPDAALSDTLKTVVTSMFLHGNLLHLAANLWFLFIFGPPVENRLGSVKTLLLFLIGGTGAAFAQFAVAPSSTLPMIGASGAIAAILGAYLFLFPLAMVVALVPWIIPLIPVPAFVFLLLWFAFQFFMGMTQLMDTGVTGGVAWFAHIGGFIVGFCLAILLRRRRRS